MFKIIQLWISFFILVSCGLESGGSGDLDGVPSKAHRVFVTSRQYTALELSSISNADSLCMAAAQSQGLVRDYKAIISIDALSAKSRLNFSGDVYKVDSAGETYLVVSVGNDLWATYDRNLLNPVDFDETGLSVSSSVWTGTNSDGGTKADSTCESWTSNSGSGFAGQSSSQDSYWLEDSSLSCSSSLPIYCISQ